MARSESAKVEVVEKAHCPTCDREQNCTLHGRVDKRWEYDDRMGHSLVGGDEYSLLECRGCETVFLETSSWNENDIDQWYDHGGNIVTEPNYTKVTLPRPSTRRRPDWVDKVGKLNPTLFYILDETYRCYDEKCLTLAAIGLRTALDSCFTSVNIDAAKSFQEKLKELRDKGYIGDTEHQILTVLTDAGNAAAHRAWSPTEEETTHLLDVLENFIHRVIINGKQALAMKDGIPAPQKRKANKHQPLE